MKDRVEQAGAFRRGWCNGSTESVTVKHVRMTILDAMPGGSQAVPAGALLARGAAQGDP